MNMQPELQPVRSNPNPYGTFGAAISAESQKVLRNTYLLLALTMVPTLAGAFIGMGTASVVMAHPIMTTFAMLAAVVGLQLDRKSTRLNSSHVRISYAVFCLKKKKKYNYACLECHRAHSL